MSITLWKPEPDPILHQALGKLAEECAELSQALAQCLIQGYHEEEPVTHKLNRTQVMEEVADVKAAMRWLFDVLDEPFKGESARERRKLDGFKNWQAMLEAHFAAARPTPKPDEEKMPPPLASKLGDDGAAVCRDASNGADGYEKVTASYEAGIHGRAKTSQSGHEMQSPATGFGGSEKPRACPYYDGITQRCPDILMGVECRGPFGPVSKFPEGGE
ncbi:MULTISPECIES: nucleoside triphosphate pyrophosphohydrolase family protein [unclassified Rhizobium]|uniref:hypothetical protein n=1 Tax=unclassified Rhizobium TaxID=2613769 RepID=UPI001ADCCE44|nr:MULTISPECIES: hypothetical protein [unclassified Rhizobium]MBO9099969.1 hypothetical protein [Rhizobium sp. L58/93]QXZ82781.1 hypothetical protein J5287_11890 [Rhizobium sp. K1/93]QXZ89706.1 hypothetical protein J5280_16700 [Rhizobium sp. K15/93]